MIPHDPHVLRKQSFEDRIQWWDKKHPEFKHKQSKWGSLLPSNRLTPALVVSHLAKSDAEISRTLSPSDQGLRAFGMYGEDLEVDVCRKLCEQGRIANAVDALDLLVQRRCYVPSNLFCRLLKRCIALKDLVSGRLIHAFAVQSGYEGDPFVATQLIGLYASRGKLKDAMRVFTSVPTPNAYNWASIIFAFARDKDSAGAAEAVRLYGQMRQSTTVEPDDRVYSAVLKACATARNLAAGKEVHGHILANAEKPDRFVQAGLVDMYSKCGSLEDARRVFDTLAEKNVVVWNAMIAGYAKQGMGQEALKLYNSMQKESLIPPDSVTFVCLLQACASVGVGALPLGKKLHAQIKQRGMEQDVVLGGSLVNMYVKCGSLEDARQLFNKLRVRNVVTWTAMIAGYAQKELGHEALLLFRSMQQEGLISPNSVTYLCLLQACASVGVGSLSEGKELHAQIRRRGLQEEVALSSSLINMYVKCGSLEDARTFFDNLPERTVVTWNAMLAGYTQQGMGMGALSLYSGMQQEGLITPNSVTYICLLQACAIVGQGALHEGIQLHALVKEQQLQEDVVVAGSLVNMYAKCGSLEDSQRLFDRLPEKNVVTWNAMIAGYAQQGMGQKALSLYRRMQQEDHVPPNSITFACLLQACASVGVDALHEGKWLHVQIKEQGLEDGPLGSSLVNMYAKCGSVQTAQRLFDRLPERTVVAWTAMLAGYTQLGMGQEALVLYSRMEQEGLSPPDCVTYVCLLQACAHVGVAALHHGKQLHAQIKERGLQEDVVLGGSLVNMYAKCGNLEDARQVFDSLPERNVQTWNAMLGGYAQQDMGQEALGLYSRMQEEGITPPNLITYVCLLQACANVGAEALHEGRHLHAQIKERGLQEDGVLAGSLINMYAKSGSLEDARQLFDKLSVKNAVTWTAMIAGYAQKELGEEALSLYTRMRDEGLILGDSIMYVCLLQACAVVAALPLGKQLHAEIDERGMQGDLVVVTALVNMYAKCGSMRDSQLLFDSLIEKSVEAWGALIDGYARQGNSEVVFSLFDGMTQEGIEPDAITFLSVLTVCSHSGLVDKGRKYFEAMRTDYGINATSDHLTCMMDLFGRAGYLDEALQMAKSMPSSSTGVVWLALLAACQKWNDIEIGQQVFDLAVKFDENEAAAYVMMSNIYARAEMWEEAKEMHARRLRLGAWKEPGRSWWTDMDGMVHSFVAGNRRAESEYYLCKAGTGNSRSTVVQEEDSLTTRRNSSLSARPGNGNRSTD